MSIEILDFKAHQKNTLRGFVDLRITKMGLTIKGCTFHEKNGKRWIGLPAKSYRNEDGQTTWTNFLFFEGDFHWRFQEAALAALDDYLKKPPTQEEQTPDDIPF